MDFNSWRREDHGKWTNNTIVESLLDIVVAVKTKRLSAPYTALKKHEEQKIIERTKKERSNAELSKRPAKEMQASVYKYSIYESVVSHDRQGEQEKQEVEEDKTKLTKQIDIMIGMLKQQVIQAINEGHDQELTLW